MNRRNASVEPDMQREQFQPISVKPPGHSPLLFLLRCFFDLQLGSIVKYLKPALPSITGRVLDVGAGQSPWREWLSEGVSYQGIDVGYSDKFGMGDKRSDIVYYDGGIMPFGDSEFDCVLCIEVLEHSEDPVLLISEIARVLKPGAVLLLTVPWSARQHHLPHDYHRFTKEGLRLLLTKNGFHNFCIHERSNDIGAIANKLTVLTIRLLRPKVSYLSLLWKFPAGVMCGALAFIFILSANISIRFDGGANHDPLGYFINAKR